MYYVFCCFMLLVIVGISMMHNNHFFGYGAEDNGEVLYSHHYPSASYIQVKQYLDMRSRKLIADRRKLGRGRFGGAPSPPRYNPPTPYSSRGCNNSSLGCTRYSPEACLLDDAK
ncbi:hypothetical protein C5167_045107 [Papaver somniferum]|uniref:Uncharacterized protein n=1 Tax=Papaver somniferum TaxID=3469 RepID=A0A4Y7LDP8_PAPSO|nr:hypothetical protein C5167_045107 [Papaver somniferum]